MYCFIQLWLHIFQSNAAFQIDSVMLYGNLALFTGITDNKGCRENYPFCLMMRGTRGRDGLYFLEKIKSFLLVSSSYFLQFFRYFHNYRLLLNRFLESVKWVFKICEEIVISFL